nr:golgin subfamily A member 4 isoform X4 [Crassostrea gigas]
MNLDISYSFGHETQPPSSSRKTRIRRFVAPQSSSKYEEYREKEEFGNEHKLCNAQLSVKEKELNSLKDILKHEQFQTKQLIHQKQEKEDELTEMRLNYMRLRGKIEEYKKIHDRSAEREKKVVEQQTELEKMCKEMKKFKQTNDALRKKNDDMEDRISKLQTKLDHLEPGETHQLCVEIRDEQIRYIKKLECEVGAQDKNFGLLQNEYDRLVCRAENLCLELKILQREKENAAQQNSELTRALQAKGTEVESLVKYRERSEEQKRNLQNNEITYIQKSRRLTVNEGLQQLLAENSSLKSTLKQRTLEIENLSNECEKQRQTREKGEHEMTELEQVVQKKANEVEELNTRLEEFCKKCSALHRDKDEAHAKISALTDALHEKKRNVESLTIQLERSETHVSVLNSRIDDMQRMNTDAVDKSKSIFQNENASLKLAYEPATFRIKDLSKQLTNGKQDKENAENQIDSLSNTLFHKEKELESAQNKLTRYEKNNLILSQDIKDIQASKRLADEKLQGLQTENTSMKSALSNANNKIDDFLNKGTNLQKYKKDAEQKTSALMNTLKDKETEIEALREQLARAEENVSILSQDIKDIQASKRQAAEDKLQRLQTENASLSLALSKATYEIEDLLNKGTNLQKHKADAEHKTSSLMNALREKDTENEALREQAKKNVSILSKDIKDMQASKRQVAEEKLQSLKTENASLKSALSKAKNEIEDLLNKDTNLQKCKRDAEHKTSTLMNALQDKETEIEALNKQLARSEENVSILSKDIKNIQESKCQDSDEKLQSIQTENASLKSALSKAKNEIEDLLNKGTNLQKHKADAEHKTSSLMNALREKDTENEALREQLAWAKKNVSILSKDIKDMQASKRQVAEEKLQSLKTENASLKSALSKAKNEIEDLLNKGTNLQKHKADAEHKTSSLMNALREKDTENEALREQLAWAKKNVSILSKDIKDMQASKRQVAEEKLQSLKTENASLKSALSKAKNEIEDLLNKDTNLQKCKRDAEHKTSTLMNALQDRETEIEALNKQLARSEENVSILSKDIKNIQESKCQDSDEKLQSIQTENASLKSALSKAKNEIDDLWNKCTNLQKYKSDTELEIGTLLNVEEEKETEIETLHQHLARSEKNVSILSKDIKDIQGSKRQADERVQSLQTENASIKLELTKATTEMNELSHKCKYLQNDKENAERTINNLSKTVQERDKEIDSLVEKLENYDKIRRDSNEVKRKREHELKRLNSVAEAFGKRDSKGLM